MSASNSLKIAIIGAGPSGLALGNILQRNSVPFQIYELSDIPRSQGGSLDLHPQFGQQALKEAGLWEDFTALARPEADVMKLVDPKGNVIFDANTTHKREVTEENKFDHRPEIDRGDLLKVLLGRLAKDSIKWSHKLDHIEPVGSIATAPKYNLHFADGEVETGFSMVVGADGAWSKVRPLLTVEKPTYSGITNILFAIPDADRTNPEVSEFAGAGNCFSFDDDRCIQAQRQGDGSVRTYANVRVPENFANELAPQEYGIDWNKPQEAGKKYVDAFFADYAPDMLRLLTEAPSGAIEVRPLYHLPVGFRWEHAPGTEGLTLLGDAAHVMTPFAGVGVNAALADSVGLGHAILRLTKGEEPTKTVADVVTEYETAMFPRGAQFAARTRKGLHHHFTAGGCQEMADRILAGMAEEQKKREQQQQQQQQR